MRSTADADDRASLLRSHPRPTLARPGWASLDGDWEFTTGAPGDNPADLTFDQSIVVPFPPESAASGLGVDTCEEPRYRRTFTADPAPGHRVLLHFEGVDHDARVWVNGHLVGGHAGGYTPFALDVTDALGHGESDTHTLVVAASDDARDLELPRGKQAWTADPEVIWYRRSSGIWRSVWLEEVPALRIASVAWTPLDTDGTLAGSIALAGLPRGASGRHSVEATFTHDGVLLARITLQATGPKVEFQVRLGDARTVPIERLLWTPEHPRLIDVDVKLVSDGAVADEVASYTGLRTVRAVRGAVRINERPTFLRLVLEQAYWPDSQFTAPSLEALRAEAQLIADLGFNGLRMHQVSADPRFLRACDELGLLVWADLPAAQLFTPAALERTTANLTELVARDRNHPSLIAWVPFNESWGIPRVARELRQQNAVVALQALAKALDPTRLALGNDGWEHVTGDVIGVHDYSHEPAKLKRRYLPGVIAATLAWRRPGARRLVVGAPRRLGRTLALEGTPVVLSEFGGVSLDSDQAAWRGYGRVRSASALVERVSALVDAVGPDSGLAGWCWTQLTDTLQEQNGLTWPDRTPKAPIADLRAAITESAQA
ncbi:sugar-binding domain-containing protein [Propioniciclava soli]|uniref:sugar-binding domain-containing protein n=1 Tax=Propioniciclava soli TaxID=2775081 RepID=UPI001E4FDB9B|nr:sugar-binding domain-containing protein [Propioniciclava soli]